MIENANVPASPEIYGKDAEQGSFVRKSPKEKSNQISKRKWLSMNKIGAISIFSPEGTSLPAPNHPLIWLELPKSSALANVSVMDHPPMHHALEAGNEH